MLSQYFMHYVFFIGTVITFSAHTTNQFMVSASAVRAMQATESTTITSQDGLGPLPYPDKWSVIYDDRFSPNMSNHISNPKLIQGYNTYIMGFYTTYTPSKLSETAMGGPMDSLQSWTNLTKTQRQSIRRQFHAANISLTFTVFGGLEDKPDWTAEAFDTIAFADELAAFVKAYDMDGVDLDWEDLSYADSNPVEAAAMLSTLTNRLRLLLPRPYIISHSVQAKWFEQSSVYGNSTTSVPSLCDSAIDFYTDMFYWSPGSYDTCYTLLYKSQGTYSGSSYGEALAGGIVTARKLTIGLPQAYKDGKCEMSDGIGTKLGECIRGIEFGGVSVWKYSTEWPHYIHNLRSAANF